MTTGHKPIRIPTADGHALLREGIRTPIAPESGMKVVAEASTWREAGKEIRKHRPDLSYASTARSLLDLVLGYYSKAILVLVEKAPERGRPE